jgi:endonuclease/exonuclease/phosphatase family metal-dependent hydrolase
MPPEQFDRPGVARRIGTEEDAIADALAAAAAVVSSVRVVTYNIHTCVGVDRR